MEHRKTLESTLVQRLAHLIHSAVMRLQVGRHKTLGPASTSAMRSFVAVALLLISACSEDNDDGLAPDTAVGDVPALSNAPRVSITFTALGNANGFLCQFDGSAQFECISPFEADVTDGPHTFAVAAKLNAAVDETRSPRSSRSKAVTALRVRSRSSARSTAPRSPRVARRTSKP